MSLISVDCLRFEHVWCATCVSGWAAHAQSTVATDSTPYYWARFTLLMVPCLVLSIDFEFLHDISLVRAIWQLDDRTGNIRHAALPTSVYWRWTGNNWYLRWFCRQNRQHCQLNGEHIRSPNPASLPTTLDCASLYDLCLLYHVNIVLFCAGLAFRCSASTPCINWCMSYRRI